GWQLPTPAILDPVASTIIGPGDMDRRAETLQKALAEYGVEARVVAWNVGPTVTQYEVEPGFDVKYKEVKEKDSDGNMRISRQEVSRTRVKVDRITALGNDLALALAAPSIRIEAPVPGKSIVGIEVPNSSLGVVPLRTVLESNNFQRMRGRTRLALALGKGAGGEPEVADLTRMPHILIAGATGSGKSVCINSLICCLALHNTPEELKMVLIDPKRVEFTSFNTLPHLAMRVIVDREKAVEALRWLAKEMDERYKTLANAGVRNIEDYNRSQRPGWPLPYIVLFVDELADLMTTAFEETEKNLCRLAQLARATGIHLVVATQRPSVDVITGLIKANFPTRISFALSSQMDSRTILDTGGAEKLLGRGDMLYLPTDAARPKRLQGCFLSDSEIERLVSFWRRQRTLVHPAPPPAPSTEQPVETQTEHRAPETPADPLLEASRRLAREHQHISASFLQRRLQVGYSRAVKLIELLEEEDTIAGEKQTEPEE
ncbi:MAG: DNA translocase FtsK, partial [Dehalococcoidia bacterium]|nr:DNA translocase FtsK [Dehalococcoidia bacterium]